MDSNVPTKPMVGVYICQLVRYVSSDFPQVGGGGSRESYFPYYVLTTCKAISKGFACGFVYWSNLDPELFCACRGERSRGLTRAFPNPLAVGSRMKEKVLVGSKSMRCEAQIARKYCNYPLATTQGDRFANCENIVSRSQISSSPPLDFS